MYKIAYTDEAEEGLAKLKRSEPSCFKKAMNFISELMEHPKTGTGHPHLLTGNHAGEWSRKISKKHRLVYKIEEDVVLVLILSAYGHYDDK